MRADLFQHPALKVGSREGDRDVLDMVICKDGAPQCAPIALTRSDVVALVRRLVTWLSWH